MNRKILGSALAIMAVLALTAGTFADFNSGRSSTTSLQTGSIVLDIGAPQEQSIIVENVQPGHTGNRDVTLTNSGSLNGTLNVQVIKVSDEEVGANCARPEIEAGDTTCTPGGGGVAGQLGSQVTAGVTNGTTTVLATDEVNDLTGTGQVAIPAGGSVTLNIAYALPNRADNNLVQTDKMIFNVRYTLVQDAANAPVLAAERRGPGRRTRH